MGYYEKSNNEKFIIAHEENPGRIIYIVDNKIFLNKKLQRPHISHVTNTGYFMVCDWVSEDEVKDIFYVFNNQGKIIIKKKLRSNIRNCAFSLNSKYAGFQTYLSDYLPHSYKLFVFDLEKNIEIINEDAPDNTESKTEDFEKLNRRLSRIENL